MVKRAIVVLVICYSIVHLGYSLVRYPVLGRDAIAIVYGTDVRRTFGDAAHWKETGELPWSDVIYPPFYYALVAPLTTLDYRVVEPVLYVLQFLWYGLAIFLMVKTVYRSGRPPPMAYVVASALTVNFHPFLETVALYKVEGLELFLICLAVYAFRTRRDFWAGVLIVFAANLKYLPGMLALYFLFKWERGVIRGMLAACGALLLILIPTFGLGTLATFVSYVGTLWFGHSLPGTGALVSFEYQTMTGTVYRWFAGLSGMRDSLVGQGYASVPHAEAARAIAGSLKLLLLGGYLYLIRRRWPPEERQARWPAYQAELSLTLLMIFVLAPVSLLHYAILLLPAFVWWGLTLFQRPAAFPLRHKVLFGLAYSLVALIIPGGLWNRLPPHPVWGARHAWAYFWLSGPFYGYLLIGLCAWLFARRLRATREPVPEGP